MTCLTLSVDQRLQWKEIRDFLHKRYSQYDKETFGVILIRVLKRLLQSGDLKKECQGHQKVYYFIPKQRKQKIAEEVDRRFLHKKMDEIWEKLSSEQRKKAVENLSFQHGLLIKAEKHLAKTFITGIKGLAETWSSSLDNSSKDAENNYSVDEKEKLKHEIDNLKILCLKVENDKIQEEDFMKTMFNEHMALSIEYWNKVVDPIYNGNGLKAIHDLMRKAVKEHSG